MHYFFSNSRNPITQLSLLINNLHIWISFAVMKSKKRWYALHKMQTCLILNLLVSNSLPLSVLYDWHNGSRLHLLHLDLTLASASVAMFYCDEPTRKRKKNRIYILLLCFQLYHLHLTNTNPLLFPPHILTCWTQWGSFHR